MMKATSYNICYQQIAGLILNSSVPRREMWRRQGGGMKELLFHKSYNWKFELKRGTYR